MQKYSINKLTLAVAAATASCVMGATPVFAATRLEEVVVTARHTEESAQTVPIASTNFTPEALAEKAIFKLDDLSASTPSLQVTTGFGTNNTPWIGLRGQRQNDTLVTLDPSVGVYLDDVYLGRTVGQLMDMVDMERVEVLKGPQGDLYGRNTTGGAIKLVTKKAEVGGDVSGYVKGGFGNYNAKRLEGGINIPITDSIAARLSVLSNQHDGYTEVTYVNPVSPTAAAGAGAVVGATPVGPAVSKEKLDDADSQMARLNVVWKATDALTFTLSGDYSQNQSMAAAIVNPNGDIPTSFLGIGGGISVPFGLAHSSGDFHKVTLNTPRGNPQAGLYSSGGSLVTDYEFSSDLLSTLILAYRSQGAHWYFDVDGDAAAALDQQVNSSGQRQESAEWRLQGTSFNDNLSWLAGLYYFKEHGVDFAVSRNFGFLDTATNAIADNKSASAFGHGSYALTDELNLNFGLRYTRDTKDLHTNGDNWGVVLPGLGKIAFCPYDPATVGLDIAACSVSRSKTEGYWSGNIGVDYKLSPDAMVYLKANNGSRSGGQNARAYNTATLQPFERESVTDIEIGLKSTWFDERVRLNVDYFHTFYKKVQETQTATVVVNAPFVGAVPVSATQVYNASAGDFDGAELELNALLTDNLSADVTLAWIDWRLDAAKNGAKFAASAAPEWSGSVALTYKIPTSYGQWSFRGDTAFLSEYYPAVQLDNSNILPGRAIYNARIALNLDQYGVDLALYGKNLGNKEYYDIQTAALGGLIKFANVGAPRTFGIEATKRF